MTRLLVATDLSARSDRAVSRAVRLASELEASLSVLHVIDEDLPDWIIDSQKEMAQKAFNQHLSSLDASAEVQVLVGKPYDVIVETAQRMEAALIILGSHRDDALRDLFIGSTAERIIRSSVLPILMVRAPAYGPYHDIVVGMDFSVQSKMAAECALSLFPNTQLHLVHAFEVPFSGFMVSRDDEADTQSEHENRLQQVIEEELKDVLHRMSNTNPSLSGHLVKGAPVAALSKELDRYDTPLLAIGTLGRTGLSQAVLGSVAEDFLRGGSCDILVVRGW